MPCHLTDIVLAKCYDENNPTTNDYLYFVESKARATSLLPNSKDSAMNDAIDGAMKDNVSRAGKTVTYLISKYAHEEKYDMARKIGRFKDSTEVPYLRFSNAAIVVDKSQLEKHVANITADKLKDARDNSISLFAVPIADLKTVYERLYEESVMV